jgi:PucR family transcriptional regulator, purine catabolism regulatory protein
MALVTVSEILRFAMPAGSTVVAGAGGLSNTVAWARMLRARPASLGRVEQGEFWLLSAVALQLVGDSRSVARLIAEMAQAGVVAFATTEPVGQQPRAEADRRGVPLVLLPADAPLAEVERSIVSFLVDRDRAITQRVQEVYERLLATLVEDHGPDLLAQVVHQVTAKAVYLLDEHFQPTVQVGGHRFSAEAIAEVRRRYWEGNLGGESVAERLVTTRPSGGTLASLGVALRPLTLRGAVEGYLALVGPTDEVGDFDHQVADRAASVLAIELAKQSAMVEARLRIQGDFLQELLDNPTAAPDQLAFHAQRLGYDLEREHLVFVLRLRPAAESTNGYSGASQRQYERFVDTARRRLAQSDLGTLLRERDGTVQVVMPCPPELPSADIDGAVEWVDRLRGQLESSFVPEPVPVAAGIGRSPTMTMTHYTAVREAIRAAEIAASMPGGPTTLHFARLGALRLIFHLAGNPELRAFQRDALGPLEASDTSRRSEFVRTLDAFLRAGGNHMRAARDLHVHRNTLIYRLERIQELLGGVDLEDPETRLNLQLALKIRSALGGSA